VSVCVCVCVFIHTLYTAGTNMDTHPGRLLSRGRGLGAPLVIIYIYTYEKKNTCVYIYTYENIYVNFHIY